MKLFRRNGETQCTLTAVALGLLNELNQ